jgi:hypothetical protein
VQFVDAVKALRSADVVAIWQGFVQAASRQLLAAHQEADAAAMRSAWALGDAGGDSLGGRWLGRHRPAGAGEGGGGGGIADGGDSTQQQEQRRQGQALECLQALVAEHIV